MPDKVLLIGYGNPGRLDDGLGPELARIIESRKVPGVTVDANYQLNVEDAAAVAEHDVVIFADAAVSGNEPFSFSEVTASFELGFSSHSVEPDALMGLVRVMFESGTRGYILGIRGYDFNEFGERLSVKARENLDEAVSFVEGIIRDDLIEDAAEAIAQSRKGTL